MIRETIKEGGRRIFVFKKKKKEASLKRIKEKEGLDVSLLVDTVFDTYLLNNKELTKNLFIFSVSLNVSLCVSIIFNISTYLYMLQ